ncbi:MAG: response regulator [Acidobacteriota bacterium]
MSDENGGQLSLLVVEDDHATREELERILGQRTSLRVVAVEKPSEALALKAPPDLALLDLRLPEMDGLELLGMLQKRNPDLLAIIMTGYGEASTARQVREHGAADFVEKPLDLPYLLVTLRQQAREADLRRSLRNASVLFRRVVELIPHGIVLTGSSGELLFGNDLGKSLWAEGFTEPESTFQFNERTYGLERSISGDRILWQWTDLTRALEEERSQTYRRMAKLLAHELHNPLTPMRLWLQEVEASSPGDPQRDALIGEAVEVLLHQLDRLGKLVGRFKTLAEDAPLELEAVDSASAAGQVVRSLAPRAEKAGVDLMVCIPENTRVMAEEGALYQILFNLTLNAIEAQDGKGGEIRIEAVPKGRETVLAVMDHGGGLPSDVAPSPFTPYLTTKEGGTGLGLLVCRELAGRMGGSVELQDQPGEGVSVFLTLSAAGPVKAS